MRTVKAPSRTLPESGEADLPAFEEEPEAETEPVRVRCPECAQPVALSAPGEPLPEHALCSTPWNPFGLTVCPGSGRTAATGQPETAPQGLPSRTAPAAVLATLPEGLHWRLQPFSHVSAAGRRRDVREPAVRQAA